MKLTNPKLVAAIVLLPLSVGADCLIQWIQCMEDAEAEYNSCVLACPTWSSFEYLVCQGDCQFKRDQDEVFCEWDYQVCS